MDTVTEVQKLLRSLKKNFECTICLELLSQPVSTKCNHQFCRSCLDKLMSKSRSKKTMKCPLCNSSITKRSLNAVPKLCEVVSAVKDVCNAADDTCTVLGRTPVLSQNHKSPIAKTSLKGKRNLDFLNDEKMAQFDFKDEMVPANDFFKKKKKRQMSSCSDNMLDVIQIEDDQINNNIINDMDEKSVKNSNRTSNSDSCFLSIPPLVKKTASVKKTSSGNNSSSEQIVPAASSQTPVALMRDVYSASKPHSENTYCLRKHKSSLNSDEQSNVEMDQSNQSGVAKNQSNTFDYSFDSVLPNSELLIDKPKRRSLTNMRPTIAGQKVNNALQKEDLLNNNTAENTKYEKNSEENQIIDITKSSLFNKPLLNLSFSKIVVFDYVPPENVVLCKKDATTMTSQEEPSDCIYNHKQPNYFVSEELSPSLEAELVKDKEMCEIITEEGGKTTFEEELNNDNERNPIKQSKINCIEIETEQKNDSEKIKGVMVDDTEIKEWNNIDKFKDFAVGVKANKLDIAPSISLNKERAGKDFYLEDDDDDDEQEQENSKIESTICKNSNFLGEFSIEKGVASCFDQPMNIDSCKSDTSTQNSSVGGSLNVKRKSKARKHLLKENKQPIDPYTGERIADINVKSDSGGFFRSAFSLLLAKNLPKNNKDVDEEDLANEEASHRHVKTDSKILESVENVPSFKTKTVACPTISDNEVIRSSGEDLIPPTPPTELHNFVSQLNSRKASIRQPNSLHNINEEISSSITASDKLFCENVATARNIGIDKTQNKSVVKDLNLLNEDMPTSFDVFTNEITSQDGGSNNIAEMKGLNQEFDTVMLNIATPDNLKRVLSGKTSEETKFVDSNLNDVDVDNFPVKDIEIINEERDEICQSVDFTIIAKDTKEAVEERCKSTEGQMENVFEANDMEEYVVLTSQEDNDNKVICRKKRKRRIVTDDEDFETFPSSEIQSTLKCQSREKGVTPKYEEWNSKQSLIDEQMLEEKPEKNEKRLESKEDLEVVSFEQSDCLMKKTTNRDPLNIQTNRHSLDVIDVDSPTECRNILLQKNIQRSHNINDLLHERASDITVDLSENDFIENGKQMKKQKKRKCKSSDSDSDKDVVHVKSTDKRKTQRKIKGKAKKKKDNNPSEEDLSDSEFYQRRKSSTVLGKSIHKAKRKKQKKKKRKLFQQFKRFMKSMVESESSETSSSSDEIEVMRIPMVETKTLCDTKKTYRERQRKRIKEERSLNERTIHRESLQCHSLKPSSTISSLQRQLLAKSNFNESDTTEDDLSEKRKPHYLQESLHNQTRQLLNALGSSTPSSVMSPTATTKPELCLSPKTPLNFTPIPVHQSTLVIRSEDSRKTKKIDVNNSMKVSGTRRNMDTVRHCDGATNKRKDDIVDIADVKVNIATPRRSTTSVRKQSDDLPSANTTIDTNVGKVPVIMMSRLAKKQVMVCHLFCKKLNAELVNDFSEKVTHLVINTDGSNCVSKSLYTYKYLMALVTGAWIVNINWVVNCVKAVTFVAENAFEVKGDPSESHELIPSKYRTTAHGKKSKLLTGYSVCLLGAFLSSSIKKEQLSNLLVHVDAKIISLHQITNNSCKRKTVILTDDRTMWSQEELDLVTKFGLLPLHPDWLVQSVINIKIQDTTEWLV